MAQANCFCFQLTEEFLRAAYFKGGECLHASVHDVRGVADEEIAKIFKNLTGQLRLKKNLPVILVIAPGATTNKNIEIPSVDREEIKSIINLQAGRHTPYSREEILVDYINIGVFQRNYSKVLLVIINRNIIKKPLNLLTQVNLKLNQVLFAPEAIAHFYTGAFHLEKSAAPTGIIDIANTSTDFIIIFQGAAITCRSIPVGFDHLIKEGQAGADRLLGELKKSIEAYQGEDIEKPPQEYFLTTNHAKCQELLPLLKSFLKGDVSIGSYLPYVKINLAAGKMAEESNDSLLSVIASGRFAGNCRIDLVPEEVKMQRNIEAQGREVITSAILTVLIIVSLCIFFVNKIYFKSTILNHLKANYSSTHKEAEVLEQLSEKTRIVKDFMNSRLASLDVIKELYNLIPNEMYLNNITIDDKGTIVIQGTSESMSRVFGLVTALENSKMFKEAKTNSTSAKKERGKDVAAFEITFRLESAKDEGKGDEAPKDAKKAEEKTAKEEKE